MRFYIIFALFCFQAFSIEEIVGDSRGVSNGAGDFYRAAVVEYAGDEGSENLTPEQILWKNVENYEKIIAEAAEEDTDIIVFPEYGLTSTSYAALVKNKYRPLTENIPEVGANPCSRNELLIVMESEVIHHLSCAAKKHRMYVAVNLGELVPSTDEAGNVKRDLRYNTLVVFDRSGTIVAKYHKYNLFAEPQFDAPEIPELSTFTTDFGVEFGVFVCFDMLFQQPAKQLVANGIKHFIFSTAWIDELPFLTAIQAQMFWASSSKATLLASGYHQPQFGKMGSGIYLPNGQPLNYTFNPNAGTHIIYGNVPKNGANFKSSPTSPTKVHPNNKPFPTQHYYYRENLSNYTGVTLPLTHGPNKISACDQGFCCEVQYTYNNDLNHLQNSNTIAVHKLIVFNQQRRFTSPAVVRLMGLQICAVVKCLRGTLESCAEYSTNPNENPLPGFESIQLSASPFQPYKHSQPAFTTLDTSLKIIPVDLFQRVVTEGNQGVTVGSTLIKEFKVQTLALFHRVFHEGE